MAIFGIDNEPYKGRELLVRFDEMLVMCTDKVMLLPTISTNNADEIENLSAPQKMAIQLVNQSLNLAFSIRELIRQGYLFGALTLERSFAERVVTLLYLKEKPDHIKLWEAGWNTNHNNKNLKAPGFAKMIAVVGKGQFKGAIVGDNCYIASPSKTLNNTRECDELCASVAPWLVCLLAMICHYFPDYLDPDEQQGLK
ncbi:DUF5677 domain-containing protein [Vibrio europaeus]|uniref:DUF5677 domain-containing protein n=1 Tax=Vibrio europaeus TaxID=300876 RepID=UPI00233EC52D|nr:DUF5677 domain-containing protein [Vibrio europaeus]MDC5870533.1 DUF5677 domain-containing protein [Vibrio europaeus]